MSENMVNSESIPLMTQTVANQSSIYNYGNPNTRRLTLEEQYQNLSQNFIPANQQPSQSSPYDDYINTLNSCNDLTKERLLQDERFNAIYTQCEAILKQYLYAQIIPTVLQTQQGRIMFEQLHSTTKSLKEEYTQKDMVKERQLELLMQDEVVLRRLQELQNASAPQPTQHTTTNLQSAQVPSEAQQSTNEKKQGNYSKNHHQSNQGGAK